MLAGIGVEARIRQPEALDRSAADNMRLDDFVHVSLGDMSVPDRVWVDHKVWPMLALIETPGLVGTHFAFQSALGQFLLKQLLQPRFRLGIAASSRMSRRPLVPANEDVFFELGHQATAGTLSPPPISASHMPLKSTKYPCTSTPGIAAFKFAAARRNSPS